MDWIAVVFVCTNIVMLQARHDLALKKIIEIIKRRNYMNHRSPILGRPRYPEDLPGAEPILPGHTLIRPSLGMLKSAVEFPLRDSGDTLVYGNKNNLGITYDGKFARLMYSDFRKANNLWATLSKVIEASKKQNERPPLIVMEINPGKKSNLANDLINTVIPSYEKENDAQEILDEIIDPETNYFDEDTDDFRRRRKKQRSKYRHRHYHSDNSSSSSDSDSSSGSSDYEKNPGNPFTIKKQKYLQNWPWNHVMDGDHMNINPYGPQFNNLGPSGPDLFFGRKWWYFNQDDYKPMS